MQPRRPTHLSEYAEACLQALSVHGLGETISLGGAVGLLHYFDYAQHRPLEEISDPAKCAEAEQVRRWVAQEFLNALTE